MLILSAPGPTCLVMYSYAIGPNSPQPLLNYSGQSYNNYYANYTLLTQNGYLVELIIGVGGTNVPLSSLFYVDLNYYRFRL